MSRSDGRKVHLQAQWPFNTDRALCGRLRGKRRDFFATNEEPTCKVCIERNEHWGVVLSIGEEK